MNKKIALIISLLLISSPAFAAEKYQGGKEVRGEMNPELNMVQESNNDMGEVEDSEDADLNDDSVNAIEDESITEDDLENGNMEKRKAMGEERRSGVANAVQELLMVADREGGIGEKVREIAMNHEKDSNEVEDIADQLRNRGQFRKFFFGPDYKKISDAEEILARHEERLAELTNILPTVESLADKSLIENSIQKMEEVKVQLQSEVAESEKVGFSLFGWLNKILNKR